MAGRGGTGGWKGKICLTDLDQESDQTGGLADGTAKISEERGKE